MVGSAEAEVSVQTHGMAPALPVTVIAGYLGAGKTTLLNHVLTNEDGLRAAVVVNDFGEINIDVGLLADHRGKTISLANGCLCCTMSGGFAQVMHDLAGQVAELDCVLVEASGVAEPDRLAAQFQAPGCVLASTMVVVDAVEIRDLVRDRYVGRTVWAQLAAADLLILNKIDLADADSLDEVRSLLTDLDTSTPVVETSRGQIPLGLINVS